MYEEYMNNLLGIRNENSNYDLDFKKYDNNYNYDYNYMQSQNMFQNRGNDELETLYPETYKIVYPMVKKVCMQNTKPITQELVDNMTNEIYYALEDNEMANVREKEDIGKAKENRTEDKRQIRNNNLNDLIRILLLRELLGRPGFPIRPRPPVRPPRPPMRPPMGPGPRPPRPGMRTYNQNMYENEYNIFE